MSDVQASLRTGEDVAMADADEETPVPTPASGDSPHPTFKAEGLLDKVCAAAISLGQVLTPRRAQSEDPTKALA
jgi:hypothetical protein